MLDANAQQSVLCRTYQQKIVYLLSRSQLTEQDISSLLQGFFKNYLTVQYAFTLQELKAELEKKFMPSDVKEQICSYVDDYTQDQFSAPQQLTQERLRQYVDRFNVLLDALNPKQDSREEPSVERLAQKLMALAPTRAVSERTAIPVPVAVNVQPAPPASVQSPRAAPSRVSAEPLVAQSAPAAVVPSQMQPLPTREQSRRYAPGLANTPSIETESTAIANIHVLLEKAYAAIEKDKHAIARKHYKAALKLYDALSVAEQSHCYLALESLYKTIT